jgi:hypothetical protein
MNPSARRRVTIAVACVAIVAFTPRAGLGSSSPESRAPIFKSSTLLTGIQIKARLSDLFKKSRDKPEKGNKSTVPGIIQYVDPVSDQTVTIEKVEFSIRGGTSRLMDQCTFAKLSVRFEDIHGKRSSDGTIFEGLRKIKIGTHCGESPQTSPTWGRIRNQTQPIREALIYTILDRVGTVTLKARPAVITYVDTSKKVDQRFFPTNPLTRNAFFLEHEDESAKRYRAEIAFKSGNVPGDARNPGPQWAADPKWADPVSSVLAIFAQALVENDDWVAKDGDLWNVNALKTKTGKLLLQVYDWDVSGWVRGPGNRNIFARGEKAISDNKALTKAFVNDAKQAYIEAQTQIYADLDEALPEASLDDPQGRRNIKNHLDDFYRWIAKL